MWVFLNRFHIKPNELEDISIEDQNVIMTLLKYETEKTEQDEWKRKSEQQIHHLLHPK